MVLVKFNHALQLAAQAALDSKLPKEWPVRIIRDVYGRIAFAVDCDASHYPTNAKAQLATALKALEAYATRGEIIFRDDLANPDMIFKSKDWHLTTVPAGYDADDKPLADLTVSVLDRQIMGQDWLNAVQAQTEHPHRFVFYGLKGGVGRSTALAMVAYGLARDGKNVLLIDFDLESPGLSSLLLPSERVSECGLVDWFVEDAVGQGTSILKNLISSSPLADTTSGSIRVAAAMGQGETAYLSKLARVYADVSANIGQQRHQRFATRMQRLVELLEEQEKPDVVLIDSRAGLHDVAAISITSLADTALLFANDGAQNWMGYRQLFTHWQHRPTVCRQVRERLAIVQALAPKSDREKRSKAFLDHSYDLFSSTLYDEIAPAQNGEFSPASLELYNPMMEDQAAPHFPIRVDWDEVFQEFDPKVRPEMGGVSDAEIDAKFGALINWVKGRLAGHGHE